MTEASTADGLGRFLTLADAAQILNVSPAAAQELVTSGELPAIRVSSHWRIERTVLETYIEAMYEQTRRMSLWNQSDFASVAEAPFGQRRAR